MSSLMRLVRPRRGSARDSAPAAQSLPAFEGPPDYPALSSEHLAGAGLHATREDMLLELGVGPGAVIAEVGVAMGDLSRFLLDHLKPSRLVAIDSFELHLQPQAVFRGRRVEDVFGGRTHADYFRHALASHGDVVELDEGQSWERLGHHPDGTFDLIYIDAGHDYDSVRRDAALAVRKVKTSGVLVFNDYVMYDHLHKAPYGVVQNVNHLVVDQGWRVAGFALQRQMFCDVALRRAS